MSTIQLEVLTPEKRALSKDVKSVYLQGSQGRLGILPQHASLIAKLDFGTLEIESDSEKQEILCGAGLVEVVDDRVTVLVRSAETAEDIDVERATRAQDRANSLKNSRDKKINIARAEAALFRATQRISFSKKG